MHYRQLEKESGFRQMAGFRAAMGRRGPARPLRRNTEFSPLTFHDCPLRAFLQVMCWRYHVRGTRLEPSRPDDFLARDATDRVPGSGIESTVGLASAETVMRLVGSKWRRPAWRQTQSTAPNMDRHEARARARGS